MLWTAFILLCIAVLIGAWCFLSMFWEAEYWRSVSEAKVAQRRLACIGASLLLVGAMCFAAAAFLEGHPS